MKSVDEEPPPATVAGQARRPTLGALSASNTNSALEMLRGILMVDVIVAGWSI